MSRIPLLALLISTLAACGGSNVTDGLTGDPVEGANVFAANCASCHGADLAGGEMAPSLTGGEFTANWNDLSLGDLYERLRISMPQSAPGSLSRQQNSDILAYVLRKMNAPVGTTEVSTVTEELKGIKFLAAKPGGN